MAVSGRWTRRRRAVFGGLAVAAGVLALVIPLRALAAGSDAILESAAGRLPEIADFLENASDASQLADAVPLSELAPADALALADVFDDEGADAADSLKEQLASLGTIGDTAELVSKLDAVHVVGPGGVTIDIGGPAAGDGGDGNNDGTPVARKNADDSVDIGFHVAITKQVAVPVRLTSSLLDVMGSGTAGKFPITFSVATNDLHFHYDNALDGDPGTALDAIWILVQPDNTLFTGGTAPKITATVETAGATLSGPFTANLGFTAVDVTGTLDFDFGYALTVVDPDTSGGNPGDGKVSASELISTAPEDLLTGGLTDDPATDAVHAVIAVDSELLGGSPDATITYDDDSLIAAPDGAVTFFPTTPPIGDFRNFSAQDALGAITRLLNMLNGIQGTGKLDVALPFISGKTNAVDPAAAATGSFSDVIRLANRFTFAVSDPDNDPDPGDTDIALPSTDPANPNAIGQPNFVNAQQLAAALEAALGFDPDTITLDYDDTEKRLEFGLNLGDSFSTQADLNFGDLDILSAIQMTTGGTVDLDASYDLPLTFGLDLTTEPTEPAVGGAIGSCADGIDNDDAGGTDVDDAACATARTLEQRVAIDVGDGVTAQPEVTARLGVVADDVDALARVGLLQAGVDNASLVIGSKGGEDGAGPLGPESCANGLNDDADSSPALIDMADPDCRAAVSFDIVDTDDGWLTIQDVMNTLGNNVDAPATASFTTHLNAGLDSTVPVSADLLPDTNPGGELGGGDILVTGDIDEDFTDPGELLDPANGHIDIDASDLHLADLFSFSPCSNDDDDDGDGTINDGCDAIPAVDEPEESSVALFNQIIDALQGISAQFDDLGIFPAGTLDQELPLVGVSFNDLVSFADTLAETADAANNAAESTIDLGGPDPCAGTGDDDGDGVVNDGCETKSGGPDQAPGLPESDCLDVALPPDSDVAGDDDGDTFVNDGCQPVTPSLQSMASLIDAAITRLLLPADATPTVEIAIAYDPSTHDLTFDSHIAVDRVLPTQFTLGSLPGILGTLVSVDPLDAEITFTADLQLDFGLNLDDFEPFVLGSSGLELTADVVGEDLFFSAGAGSLTISVGQAVATPETDCDNANEDDDGDGYVNDGCAAVPNPEALADCANGADDDGDGRADDGCAGVNAPAAGDPVEAEEGAECTDLTAPGSGWGVDDDGDDVVDDGCPGGKPPAQVADQVSGDGEQSLEEGGGANCSISDTDTDDTDDIANDGCPARADKGRFFLGAGLNLDVGTATDDNTKYALGDLEFTGDFVGTDQAGCAGLEISAPTLTGPPVGAADEKFGCAILPLYLDGTPIGSAPDGHHVEVAITDFSPLTISVEYDTSALTTLIGSKLIDLVLMNSGIDALLNSLQSLLESDLFSFSLPLIGDQAAAAAQVVDKLRATVKEAINTAVAGGNPLTSGAPAVGADEVLDIVQGLADGITTAITGDADLSTLGGAVELYCDDNVPARGCDTGFGESDPLNPAIPGGGTDAMCEDGGETTPNTLGDGDDNDNDGVIDDGCAQGPNPAPAAETALNVEDIRTTFEITGTIDVFDVPDLNFDIGIPGLGLTGDLHPKGTVEWTVKLGFGVSRNQGFYFFTGNDPELDVTFDVTLSDGTPAELDGQLGFLQVKIVDGDPAAACTDATAPETPCRRSGDTADPASLLHAGFSIDVTDPGGTDDSKLTFADLSGGPSFSDMFVFALEASADVNLHIETGFAGGAGLPKLIADLHLDWTWGIDSSGDPDDLEPGDDSELNIVLDNVGLDVGTYVTKFLKPIFGDVKRFTDPLKPVIDTVTACIPVLSDLSSECVSLLTLAELLNPDINFEFIKDVIAIVKFIQALPTSAPGNLTIPIGDGSFNLAGDHLQDGPLAPEEARSAFTDTIDGLPSLLGALNGNSFVQGQGSGATSQNGVDAPALSASGLADIGVSFPFLQQPEKMLGLLFGQDVDLIVWEPDQLDISFSYSQKFGPIWPVPPVFIEIGGSVTVTGRFGIGYNTKGFRNWLVNDQGPAALLQGLFLVDRHPLVGGPDSNELELTGELFANAQVSVLIFSAGAQGSIYLTIGIDLQDPNSDGRLEYTEAADIIRRTGNVLCIFNLNGKFGVRISVFAEVDLFFWSQRWEFTLADIVLYEFKVECEPLPDPVLARKSGTELHLNVGDSAYLRDPEEYASPPYIPEPGETPAGFTNSPDGVADNSVGNYPDVTTAENFKVIKVEHEGGGFDVSVTALGVTQIYPGPISKIVGSAGSDDDKINLADSPSKTGAKLIFDIPSDLNGGAGLDELIGSSVADTLVGGGDADLLTGKDGVNTIHGDNADGTGNGADVIVSGTGDDFLYGEGGDDRISAGVGSDKVVGGDGSDNLDGGRSTPTQADGNDTMWGDNEDGTGSGDDHIDGNDGTDTIHAGFGEDRADGGIGTDTIDAGGSSDAACSGNLDDVLIGGPGVDAISAGDGDDIVIGGSVLAGQPDAGDTLDGQNDCDTIFGDNALQGPDGPFDVDPLDPTIGAADTIRGGNDADQIHGQLGGDTIDGDDDESANDTDDGDDFIYGEEAGNATGDDIVHGEGGNDTVFGSLGDDDLVGGTGDDHIYGEGGQDFILGDDGDVTRTGARDAHDAVFGGGAGDDHLFGGGDRDHMYGQGGVDEVNGDGGDDEAFGDTDEAANDGVDEGDTVRGGVGNDLLSGGNADDDLFGESGNDRMIGGYIVEADDDGVRADLFQDHMYGGSGTDVMAGDDASITLAGVVTLIAEATEGEADLMYGEADADKIYGENGNDKIRGGDADDHAEGGDDSDDIAGEAGNDDLIGGTTEDADGGAATGQQPDAGDVITGGTGGDVILGDNGQITRPGGNRPDGTPTRIVTLWDLNDTSGTYSGDDTLDGNESYDALYGGAEHDTVHGNSEDDHVEGNNGNDDLFGDAGQDDLVGGTSGEVDEDGSDTVGGNHPDTGKDVIHGNDGHDVGCGDNCSIRRTVAGPAQLVGDDLDTVRGITGVVRRQVQLYDLATLSNPLTGTTTSDGDDVFGDDAFDVLYGQGGDDLIDGGAVDDYLEGNAGHDTVYGQGGQDDILGGNGRTTSDDPATAANFRLDTDDDLYGGDGAEGIAGGDDYDVVMGDNATILRGAPFPTPAPGSAWGKNTFNGSVKRAVFLYDVATTTNAVNADTNGPDLMRGEADDDLMYGQGDGDDMDGAAGDDFMEGNEGADTIIGGTGNDDMIGGTGHINNDPFNTPGDGRPIGADFRLDSGEVNMSGEEGFDWMAGDNAVISRVLDGSGAWVPDPNGGIKRNRIWLQDVAVTPGPAISTIVSGGDGMHGNEHNDVMYGQGNGTGIPDLMTGDAGDDLMEGNAGADQMFGNADQDDMSGGTGLINNDPITGTNGRLDGGDTMSGGTHADFQLGDNGKIVRAVNGSGVWTFITEYNPTTIRRQAFRFDVAGAAGTSGADVMDGNEGDDYQWGQDGGDLMHGNDDNDDMQGELGDDVMFGDRGEDAMVGDRGNIVDTKLADNSKKVTSNTQGPAFFVYVGLVQGQLDRRVSLTDDGDGAPFPSMGLTVGGKDQMRGGPGHDSMHGAFGDDLMNGDSQGDWLFGDDGADVMWGGKGADPSTDAADPTDKNARDRDTATFTDPFQDRYIDYLFGAHGGLQSNEVEAADILDYLPRAANPSNGFPGDPAIWFTMTDTGDGDPTDDQYHQGIDWIYGGFNRDVLEGDVGKNGPDFGDRLMDWLGGYNLFTRCNASYGDDGDIRQIDPAIQNLLHTMAYGSGAGVTANEVKTAGTSAYRELGLVYPGDKLNNGKAFPTTPGHFQDFTCQPVP